MRGLEGRISQGRGGLELGEAAAWVPASSNIAANAGARRSVPFASVSSWTPGGAPARTSLVRTEMAAGTSTSSMTWGHVRRNHV